MSACGQLCAFWRKFLYIGLYVKPRLHAWHSHRQSHSHFAFSSLSDQWEIRLFFIFAKLFFTHYYRFLYLGDQKISWWTSCRWRVGGQLRNPPVKFRHERWLHLVIDQHPVCPNLVPAWTLTSEFDRINWPLTSAHVSCNGRVWKQFRCLRLFQEACGAPPRQAILFMILWWEWMLYKVILTTYVVACEKWLMGNCTPMIKFLSMNFDAEAPSSKVRRSNRRLKSNVCLAPTQLVPPRDHARSHNGLEVEVLMISQNYFVGDLL